MKQVVKLFGSELLYATGREVGQTKVLNHLLIAPGNAGGQRAAGFMTQARLRNQGISSSDPRIKGFTLNQLALWCRNLALSYRIMGATVLD
ncbi:hypothetical protein OBA47_00970 [bacterium]|nr:hypothetical protein [bacterium]